MKYNVMEKNKNRKRKKIKFKIHCYGNVDVKKNQKNKENNKIQYCMSQIILRREFPY